jgi:hypothetical protein
VTAGATARIATRARLDPARLLVACVLASGCLRAPIGDDYGDGSHGLGSSGEAHAGDSSDATALDEGTDETTPAPACHSSYVPCLPVVDDLDCSDVIELGVAPVMVIGPDDYGLDNDHDGLGCEP